MLTSNDKYQMYNIHCNAIQTWLTSRSLETITTVDSRNNNENNNNNNSILMIDKRSVKLLDYDGLSHTKRLIDINDSTNKILNNHDCIMIDV
jgi:hypothetical protein